MGHLTASIAHEVSQPIAAAVINAEAGLRLLDLDPPDLDEVRETFGQIVVSGQRAAKVLDHIRSLIRKESPRKGPLDVNATVLDVVALVRNEVVRHGVSLETRLATCGQQVQGDRVQLQQVILNVILNALEAMSGVNGGPRELIVSVGEAGPDQVLVAVQDSGPGFDPADAHRIFDPFYTTKPTGMGMGLAICKSIVEAHGGRMWAAANKPHGGVLHFTLPRE
jgi:signal transduction histidine kinase